MGFQQPPCRLVLALFLLAALLAAAGSRRVAVAQAQDGVGMSVEVGYDQRCMEGTWLPVRVVLENNGPQIEGQVEVRIPRAASGPIVYQVPVSLPTTSRKEVTVYVYPQGFLNSLDVHLTEDRRELASVRSPVTCSNQNDLLFGVIAGSPSAFGVLNDLPVDNGNAYVLQMDITDVPERGLALAGLDGLVLSDVDTGQLTIAQRQAMAAWVANGGQLIVTGGPGWQKTAAGLKDLLPLIPAQTETVESLEELVDFSHASSGDLAGSVVVATGDLSPGAFVLASAGDLPLVVKRDIGAGSVIYMAFDPAQPPLRSWDRSGALFQSILSARSEPPGWNRGFRNWDQVRSAAGSVPALNLPSVFLVCGFLALYVIVAGPLHYLFLKRRKRNELAWISLPALVIFFSGMTFALGNMVRGNRPILNRLAIVQAYPQADLARVDGVVGLFSPARARYQVNAGPEFLIHPLPVYNDTSPWNITASAERAALENLQIEVGGLLPVAVEGIVQAPQVSHDLRLVIDSNAAQVRLEGQITNQSDLILKDAALLAPGTTLPLGELKPGEPRQVDLILDRAAFSASEVSNPSFQVPPGVIPPGVFAPQPYDTTVEDIVGTSAYYEDQDVYRRYNLVAAALGNYGESAGRGGGIYLSGWTDSSPLAIELVDRRYETIDTTLYLIRLDPAIEAQEGRLVLPAGLFTWMAAGSTSYDTVTPYGMYLNSGNSVTFSYKLAQPLAYREVTGLTLHLESVGSSNPGDLEVSLWDFSAEAYQQLTRLVWGDNSIPDPARFVGPGGLIRVSLRNEQVAGQISLEKVDFTLTVEQ